MTSHPSWRGIFAVVPLLLPGMAGIANAADEPRAVTPHAVHEAVRESGETVRQDARIEALRARIEAVNNEVAGIESSNAALREALDVTQARAAALDEERRRYRELESAVSATVDLSTDTGARAQEASR